MSANVLGEMLLSKIDFARLKIIEYPDPRLRKKCAPVEVFDADLERLTQRMCELMHEHNGVGLAAPQVGILQQVFVCNVTGDPKDDTVYVNAELTDLEGDVEGSEGCLSIPDVNVNMHRALKCTLTGKDLKGKPIKIKGEELSARVWQHEMDHINGRLIIDNMSEADKVANRRSLKRLEADFKPSTKKK